MIRRTFTILACALVLAASGAALWGAQGAGDGASPARPPVNFDRDVKPILAANCFACHGPDEHDRKAGVRLDTKEGLLASTKEGKTVVAPGKAGESELLKRVTHADADERMPPKKSGKVLTPEQIDTLKRWVEQGAPYSGHWAFAAPKRPDLPEVKNPHWVRNPIDQFILARLEKEGLRPSPEADKYALIRRLSLDLTGLPPTPAEVEAFVLDHSPDAYEKLVDRLLASPAYGERMARMWMDIARYADSAGYGSDPLRKTIHRYRDWLIRAFNDNKPYDQFTVEQIAGDLLPNPTTEQLIATAFHRNTMTNTEGGTDDEEWRVAAVKDRADVTVQAWMGLTMGCAQCHSHKFDPISHKDYYSVFAVFNQTEDTDQPDERPTIPTPTPEQAAKKAELEKRIAAVEREVNDPATLSAPQAAWEAKAIREADDWWAVLQPEAFVSASGATLAKQPDGSVLASGTRGKTDTYTVTFRTDLKGITAFRVEALPDPTLPNRGPGRADGGGFVLSDLRVTSKGAAGGAGPVRGRYVRVEVPGKEKILSLAEVQVFSGGANVAPKGKASQSSTAYDGPAELAIDGNTDGDYRKAKSTSHTAESENPWWEVDLGSVQAVDRVALWNRTDSGLGVRLRDFRVTVLGEDRKPAWETRVGPQPNPTLELDPNAGEAIALRNATATFPASEGDGSAAKAIDADAEKSGWSVAPQVARAHAAVFEAEKPAGADGGAILTFKLAQNAPDAPLGRFRIAATTRPAPVRALPHAIRDTLAVAPHERTEAERAELAAYYKDISPEIRARRQEISRLKKEIDGLQIPLTAIMRELPPEKRRASHILVKGNFMAKADPVSPAVLSAFHPMPDGAPANRLGLATWLVDRNNPLTARVAANRFWAMIFGSGIVPTQEDFGTQGQPPTHPELLDWLAVEFMEGGWDVKRQMRLIVTSATYRQSSQVTPRLLEKDPRNVLIARAPRLRLDAEQVRDQALALSGLLSRKMFGPSVYPPQPDGLWQAAFNGERTYPTSTGEDRYRRGLYTFWRRTVPYPSMAAFDAPSRETCTIRRIHTSTPLQAFVTLNDPVYVEAAQALARRIVKEGGATPEGRARFGLLLCLQRPASKAQVEEVVALYQDELARYKGDRAAAEELATDPLGPLPKDADPAEMAAWTVVANVLLNLDGLLTKG